MRRIIVLLIYLILSFLLIGCSNNSNKNRENQIQTNVTKDINSDANIVGTIAPTTIPTITPTITPQTVKKINIDDNQFIDNLKELSKTPRKFDTDGEQRALKFLVDKMAEYGYQTQTQDFSVYHLGKDWFTPASKQVYFEQNREETKKFGSGINVIASTANSDTKKTLYVTAHYDTTDDTNGIRDNGSGVVVAMEIARQLQGINLPINVKYVFFSAEEAGLQGSAYFVWHLTKEEKDNAIGCINIDVVGQKGDYEVVLKTNQQNINVLSILMDEFHDFHHFWSSASDHTSFYMGEIPAIYFADNKALLKDTSENPLNELDIDKLKNLTKIICDFLIKFNMSDYEKVLQNGFLKNYTNLPETEEVNGFSLIQANKVLNKNGASSDIEYILKNDNGKQVVITERDYRFLDNTIITDIQTFNVYNDHVKYKVSEKNNKIYIQYTDTWLGYKYYILEGNITKDEALELLINQSKFTKDGVLLLDIRD